MNAVALIIDGSQGIYIPKLFVESFSLPLWGLDQDEWCVQQCLSPENEHYWEAWEEIMNKAEFKEGDYTYRLYQNDDLWALDYDRMTDEEKQNFGFEE